MLLPMLLLLACPGPKPNESGDTPIDTGEPPRDTTDTSPPPDTAETAETQETAETGDTAPDTTMVATASIVPTAGLVIEVTWTTASPGTSWVEFGEEGAMDRATPVKTDDSTDHVFHLYGLPSATSIHWRAVTVIDGTELADEGDITTELSDLPDFTLNLWDEALSSPEPYFIGALTDFDGFIFAFDRRGRTLWYLPAIASNPESNPVESLASTPISEEVIIGTYSIDHDMSDSLLYRMTMSGELTEVLDAGYAHHMTLTLPDGTLAWLEGERRPWVGPDGETYTLIGDIIKEQDPSGAQRTAFTCWDWMEPNYKGPFPEDPSLGLELDWTHANTFFYDPDTDTYLLSLANVDTALEVNRTTGFVIRSFGTYGDHPVAAGSTAFHFQHDVNWTPQGTLLMTSLDATGSEIFAIEYESDEVNMEIREIWSYGKGQGILAYCGGQARRLSNGNTWFNGGNAGVLREITPEGEVVWDLTPGIAGGAFLKMWPITDFYDWYTY